MNFRPAFCLAFSLCLPAMAEVDFSHQIVPILRQHCADCHLGDKKKGGLSFNTRKSLIEGSENGEVLVPGNVDKSLFIEVLTSADKDKRMPPKGDRVPAEQVALLRQWVAEGAKWEDGFTFGKSAYEPPLKPRAVVLPPAVDGRDHPIDRILDHVMAGKGTPRPAAVDDATFLRRVSMDLIGLQPEPAEVEAFLADKAPDRRARLITSLLARDVDYAEHWLTFWNDLLRNDYVGTGYTDGGRKAITNWLYQSLVSNKPYDQFTRELVAPQGADSEGFSYGIKWRGNVNASQVREVQFAQSICQVFLGINMKCASCHDSFIDRWKLDEAYGLAAVYSDHPLEVNRCDKPIGRTATPAWIFPELGRIDPAAPQPQRLKQLAALMTSADNGRFTRTMVNRLWQRLMGRGIVHPVDAMQTAPWNADLLDYLAERFRTEGYDMKKMLAFIASSQAYQSASTTAATAPEGEFVYRGPIARRLTAEQFVDAVWRLTGTGPKAAHGSILRGRPDPAAKAEARWIWSTADAIAPANKFITVRKRFKLAEAPVIAKAIITADNEYRLFVNNRLIGADTNLASAETYSLAANLRKGDNVVLIEVKNAGTGPNPAGVWFEAQMRFADGTRQHVGTDGTWEWTASRPDLKGAFAKAPTDWQPTAEATNQKIWESQTAKSLQAAATQAMGGEVPPYVRASLVTSDLLMRALGRPNREQIVTVRPENLTTLEAIDLENGSILAGLLKQGAQTLLAAPSVTSEELVRTTFLRALCRPPQPGELAVLLEVLGPKPTPQGVEDMLWSVLLLPEFQFLR